LLHSTQIRTAENPQIKSKLKYGYLEEMPSKPNSYINSYSTDIRHRKKEDRSLRDIPNSSIDVRNLYRRPTSPEKRQDDMFRVKMTTNEQSYGVNSNEEYNLFRSDVYVGSRKNEDNF
jgi:hypothetical protein